jgi:hypothetical protein
MAKPDLTSRPRRTLSAAERNELFREFKLGLIALSALVVLVVTLCWDRGEGRTGESRSARASEESRIQVVWDPGSQGGSSPVPNTVENDDSRPERDTGREDDRRGDDAVRDGEARPRPQPDRRVEPQHDPVHRPVTRTYMVKRNDTLWKIARTELGDGKLWTAIRDANPKCGKVLKPGVVLVIPAPLAERLPPDSLADGSTPGQLRLQSPDR